MCLLCAATQPGIGEAAAPFLGIGALFVYDQYEEIKAYLKKIFKKF